MADKHVRARCKTHGGVAALPLRALQLGMFPDWVRADGPTPKRSKPAAFPKRKHADTGSANTEEE